MSAGRSLSRTISATVRDLRKPHQTRPKTCRNRRETRVSEAILAPKLADKMSSVLSIEIIISFNQTIYNNSLAEKMGSFRRKALFEHSAPLSVAGRVPRAAPMSCPTRKRTFFRTPQPLCQTTAVILPSVNTPVQFRLQESQFTVSLRCPRLTPSLPTRRGRSPRLPRFRHVGTGGASPGRLRRRQMRVNVPACAGRSEAHAFAATPHHLRPSSQERFSTATGPTTTRKGSGRMLWVGGIAIATPSPTCYTPPASLR